MALNKNYDSIVVSEINKQINKYYEEHSHCNIVTCDLDDVCKWLEKAEKKAKKKLRKNK